MLLTQTGEYALRAMAAMASASRDAPLSAQDLSRVTDISPHYLSKVLRRLVLAGLLESRKGRGGGFTLARDPSEIRFMDVLAAVDAYPYDTHCVFGWGACNPDEPCSLHDTWLGMSESIRDWAMHTTLDQVRTDRAERPPTRGGRGGV